MKRKRYTEEQIISILKEHEAGSSVKRADIHTFPSRMEFNSTIVSFSFWHPEITPK